MCITVLSSLLIWVYNCAVTSVWGSLALRLASDDILPMKYESYANELNSYALSIVSRLSVVNAPGSISCAPLLSAIKDLQTSIRQLTEELTVTLHHALIQRYVVWATMWDAWYCVGQHVWWGLNSKTCRNCVKSLLCYGIQYLPSFVLHNVNFDLFGSRP